MSSFRRNLRNELDYQLLTVKELAAKTGIPKPSLDCYLGSRATVPNAEIAVRIAKALNVSVEYLVTGQNDSPRPDDEYLPPLYAEFRPLLHMMIDLPEEKRAEIKNFITFTYAEFTKRESEKKGVVVSVS
ncbi:helix-turn-helix domain-containing protein [Treponema brennaborense]|nr:helix-turn-helix transcriptional regulator [Treponema brennaborense]